MDDGSSDQSRKLLDGYAKDSHIKVIHKENGGVSSARNVGICHSKGTYIWFIDSDDLIAAKILPQLLALLTQYQPEVLEIPYLPFSQEPPAYENTEVVYTVEQTAKSCHAICQGIIRGDLIRQNKIYFDEEMRYGEDTLFWYNVYMQCNGYNRITIKSPVIYYYRKHSASAMQSRKIADIDKHLNDLFRMALFYQQNVGRDVQM